jgi:glycosyltransferase involved in cell wall biosynthesis
MKTLQVVGNSSYGGAGYLLIKWCEYLINQHHCKVDVLATDHSVVDKIKAIPGVRIIDHIHIPRDIEPWPDIKAFSALLSLIGKGQYDVVHTYTATPGFLGRLAARLLQVPVIVHHQAAWAVSEFSAPLKKLGFAPLEFIISLFSTRLICVSHAISQQADLFHTAPRRKLVTICNGIDPTPFLRIDRGKARNELREELGLPGSHLLIGSTGRLAPLKDNETLIRAMAVIKSLFPDLPFTLLLAGDGPDREKLESLVDSLELHKEVRLLGFYDAIPHFLGGLDVYVTLTHREGLSISLLEAMAAGLPIVSSAIPPNQELIEHGVSGLTVPLQDPEEAAAAIARLVREPELANTCGHNAQQRVLKDYTIERMFQQTWQLYVDLRQGKRPFPVSAEVYAGHEPALR